MNDIILLGHGSGGKLSHSLIHDLFFKYFQNPAEIKDTDAAHLSMDTKDIGFTTDSFVVDPLFFPGGNIGHLAVSGTVNDLAVSGYKPKYLSAGFILEEGLSIKDLERIVSSMAKDAERAGVYIVTGDTKVVDKGKCDKIFINTAGVGESIVAYKHVSGTSKIEAGDVIIVNGYIADHGMAVMAAREGIQVKNLVSDVAPLNKLIGMLIEANCDIKFMRDATRGGLATVLNELVSEKKFGVEIEEDEVPVRENVKGICEMLGFDPMYVANEGKVVMVASAKDSAKILKLLQNNPLGVDSCIIGKVTAQNKGMVLLNTAIGGKRIVDMLAGEQLPRIC